MGLCVKEGEEDPLIQKPGVILIRLISWKLSTQAFSCFMLLNNVTGHKVNAQVKD